MKSILFIKKFIEYSKMKIRHTLSHWPILYAFLGSIGVVLIWRGVWDIADEIGMSSWMSLFLGVTISIVTGLFVSFFVGDNIIISGIKKQKRIDEKTEREIKKEENILIKIKKDINEIKEDIEDIENK